MMGECCESRFKNKKQSVMEYQIAHNCQIKAESHFECVNSPRFHFTLRQWVFLFFIFLFCQFGRLADVKTGIKSRHSNSI